MADALKLPAQLTIELAEPLRKMLSDAQAQSLPVQFSPDGEIDLAGLQLLMSYQRSVMASGLSPTPWALPGYIAQAFEWAGGVEVLKDSANRKNIKK